MDEHAAIFWQWHMLTPRLYDGNLMKITIGWEPTMERKSISHIFILMRHAGFFTCFYCICIWKPIGFQTVSRANTVTIVNFQY